MTDKLPPQAPEMEQAVLGAILLEREAQQEVENILSADDFYVPANMEIYKAVQNLRHSNHPVDMLTVTEELKRTGKLDSCGGPYYISTLTTQIASASHVEYHARVVKEKADARRLITLASELIHDIYLPGADVYQVREMFERQFTALLASSGSYNALITLGEALNQAAKHAAHLQELRESGQMVAIPTGLSDLDKVLDGGWRPAELIIVAGRPSMGKTQFALWFAKAAASHGINTLMNSIEMAPLPLAGRYILEDERINQSHFRSGGMTPDEWSALHETVSQMWHLPISIAAGHTSGQLSNIKAQARKKKRQGQLDLMVVDQLPMIETNGQHFERRYLEIGYITRELRKLAQELEIPVILLTQLSRLPKGHVYRKPTLDDLRESGNIEQDADIVLLLHKPDIYDPEARDSNGKSWKNRGQLIIAKQREGARALTLTYHHDARYKKIW